MANSSLDSPGSRPRCWLRSQVTALPPDTFSLSPGCLSSVIVRERSWRAVLSIALLSFRRNPAWFRSHGCSPEDQFPGLNRKQLAAIQTASVWTMASSPSSSQGATGRCPVRTRKRFCMSTLLACLYWISTIMRCSMPLYHRHDRIATRFMRARRHACLVVAVVGRTACRVDLSRKYHGGP